MNEFSFIVPNDIPQGQRLDICICGFFSDFSRSALKSGIYDLCVSGKKAKLSSKALAGSFVTFKWKDTVPDFIEAQDIPLDIIFENEDTLVINKKQGMVVHPAVGNWSGTLVNALLFHNNWQSIPLNQRPANPIQHKKAPVCIKKEPIAPTKDAPPHRLDAMSSNIESLRPGMEAVRPGIVHRLDKDTSGVIITAKNKRQTQFLANQFLYHKIKKEYIAIVKGSLPHKQGTINCNIKRSPTYRKLFTVDVTGTQGKNAITQYAVIKQYGDYSLLHIRLFTGRTHQIRVHLKHLGVFILGDTLYGRKDALFPNATLMLHSRMLTLYISPHHLMRFVAPVPKRFKCVLKTLRQVQLIFDRKD